MPTLNLFTNVPVDRVVASDILKDASKAVAKILGKPESYVMILVNGGVPISFGGTEEPAAYGELISIGGLGPSVNGKLSATIAEIMETKLSIDSARFYIKFYDVQQVLPNVILREIDSMQSAKEMGDEIYQIMRGTDVAIKAQMVSIINEYDCFRALPGESLSDTYHRFLVIINELRKINVNRTQMDYNVRFLNSLQPEWKQVAMMLRTNKDFAEMSIHTLHDNLSLHRDYILHFSLINQGRSAAEETSAFLTEQHAIRGYSLSHRDMGMNMDLQQPFESNHFDDPNSDPEIIELKTQVALYTNRLNSKLQRYQSSSNKLRTTSFPVQRDGPRDMGRDCYRDMPRDSSGSYSREVPRDYPREIQRDYQRQVPRVYERENYPRDVPREFPRELPRDFSGDLPRETHREVPRAEPRDMSRDQSMQPERTSTSDRSWNCYKCGKPGHNAKDCRLPKVKDIEYYEKKALLAAQREKGIVLFAEQEDWLNDTSDSYTEVAEVSERFTHFAFMARLEDIPECTNSGKSDVD